MEKTQTDLAPTNPASAAMTRYEKKPFWVEVKMEHNGIEYANRADLGTECDENGVLLKKKFDFWMEVLRSACQGRLYDLGVLPSDRTTFNPCPTCHRTFPLDFVELCRLRRKEGTTSAT